MNAHTNPLTAMQPGKPFIRPAYGLFIDNFCGGGGTGTGYYMATGRHADHAINHNKIAIGMHKANHPTTEHHEESVWDVDPVAITKGEPVIGAWFSPDCRHFSKAKGGALVDKKIRGLAWVMIRWMLLKAPTVCYLENVEEFVTWGPVLANGKPCKKRKGQTFEGFLLAITTGLPRKHPAFKEAVEALSIEHDKLLQSKLVKGLGYKVDRRELRAMHYGAPTRRKRLFMIARNDGQPIVWPEYSHTETAQPGTLPVRTVAECIDFTVPGKSIFGRPKMLAENTLYRLARGFVRFVLDNPEPYIIRIGHTGGGNSYNYSIHEPLTTVTSKAEHILVSPVVLRQFGKSTGHSVTEPAGAICTKPKDQLLAAQLVHLRGTCKDGSVVTEPAPTITAGGQHLMLATWVTKYFGTNLGHRVDEPLQTITQVSRFALSQGVVTDVEQLTDEQRLKSWWCARLIEQYGPAPKDKPLGLVPEPRPQLLELQPGLIVVDLLIRMLSARELFNANGFPADYVIDRDHEGNPISQREQVARCGNAVPPQFAEALIRANSPHLIEEQQAAA